ncbi:MAG: hypothetical protein M3Y72_03425 [Acidobacteriota bacterium]|nr:hypothetical protein [Acidobacteriota bacterium]
MKWDGPGKGRLVPAGKVEPSFDVSYEISHVFYETSEPGSQPIEPKKAVVRFTACDPAQQIPIGDFDLLVDDEILRLKHTDGDPEWVILSSYA